MAISHIPMHLNMYARAARELHRRALLVLKMGNEEKGRAMIRRANRLRERAVRVF